MDRMDRREAILGKPGAEGAVASHTIAVGQNPVRSEFRRWFRGSGLRV